MNKKAFMNLDTFANPGFWILTVGGWSAVIIGYKWSLKMDSGALPLWQVIATLVAIFFAAAFFARE